MTVRIGSVNVREIRKAIADVKFELQLGHNRLAKLEQNLSEAEANCPHNHDPEVWEVKYDPEHKPAYDFQGDPEGTMGVDRMLPFHRPAETIPRWTRTCKICGKEETTYNTQPGPVQPKW